MGLAINSLISPAGNAALWLLKQGQLMQLPPFQHNCLFVRACMVCGLGVLRSTTCIYSQTVPVLAIFHAVTQTPDAAE